MSNEHKLLDSGKELSYLLCEVQSGRKGSYFVVEESIATLDMGAMW